MPTVAIIGASRGIGLGFAEAYAADGWTVHATTRTPEQPGPLGEVAGDITVHEMDVTNPAHLSAMAAALQHAALDVLIHNAGIRSGGRNEMMRVNARAPFEVIDSLLPALERGPTRKIAILTSQLGAKRGGSAPSEAYGASKAALNDRFRAVEPEWRAKGIVAVVFHPGWVRTDMGGDGAPVTVEESVTGMRRVIEDLGPADGGRFLTWRGDDHPW